MVPSRRRILQTAVVVFTILTVFRIYSRAPTAWTERRAEADESTLSVRRTTATPSYLPVVDFIAIGSLSRLDYVQAQKDTFALHMSVRNFYNVTELDDDESDCSSVLTDQDAYAISNFCRHSKHKGKNALKNYLTTNYARTQWLEKKGSPVGWLCAQKRPVFGFIKTLREYQSQQQQQTTALPDYLVIFDDDTFYNMEAFGRYFFRNASQTPKVTAGCLVRSPIHMINWTIPFGGFGTTFSRGSLETAMEPIVCPGHEACQQIEKDWVGEKDLFQNGNSILDLMEKMVRAQKFTEYKAWTEGYCYHSDWLIAYFVNWYNLSVHDDKQSFYDNVPQNRLHSYRNSFSYRKAQGYCANNHPDNSTLDLDVAHYVTPEMMHAMNDYARRQNPQQWIA